MGLTGDKRPENEALFRAANEQLKNQLSSLQEGGRIPFVWECSDADCMEVVDVPLAKYEEVRAGPEPLHAARGTRIRRTRAGRRTTGRLRRG
jgi:hypothetical protein